jgi:DNA (cytosine-5)-methyltransferase 1
MVFDEVHSDLESAGYEVQAVVIPAAAVNAPHGRDRVWFVATNTNSGAKGSPRKSGGVESNGGDGYLFKKQRGKSSEFDNRLHQFPRNATNSQFKSEGSDGGTNNETKRNIRRGNEGDVFGTLRSDGITTNTKECGCRGGVCERCADGERKLLSDEQRRSKMGREIEGHSGIGDVANTMCKGLQGGQEINRWGKHDQEGSSVRDEFRTNGTSDDRYPRNEWEKFPTQPPICGGDDGLPTELDGITFSKWRNESIKAYGNAIVPQVAYEIFKAIKMTNGN